MRRFVVYCYRKFCFKFAFLVYNGELLCFYDFFVRYQIHCKACHDIKRIYVRRFGIQACCLVLDMWCRYLLHLWICGSRRGDYDDAAHVSIGL